MTNPNPPMTAKQIFEHGRGLTFHDEPGLEKKPFNTQQVLTELKRTIQSRKRWGMDEHNQAIDEVLQALGLGGTDDNKRVG